MYAIMLGMKAEQELDHDNEKLSSKTIKTSSHQGENREISFRVWPPIDHSQKSTGFDRWGLTSKVNKTSDYMENIFCDIAMMPDFEAREKAMQICKQQNENVLKQARARIQEEDRKQLVEHELQLYRARMKQAEEIACKEEIQHQEMLKSKLEAFHDQKVKTNRHY